VKCVIIENLAVFSLTRKILKGQIRLKSRTPSMTVDRFDLVIVGHLTIDSMRCGEEEHKMMGGPPAYAMVGPALGLGHVGIVTRIGKEFPQKYYDTLASSGLNLDGVIQSKETTQFINIYTQNGNRIQYATAIADRLTSSDVPEPYWNTNWMHISPVLGETDASLITTAKAYNVKVSVDVQGFVRKRSEQDHKIVGCEWPEFSTVVSKIDILKADIDEIIHLTQKPTYQEAAKAIHEMGCPLILITWGQHGAFLSQGSSFSKIPAITPNGVVDHTGSGDVFAISFLAEYQQTQRPLWSAFFASSCASFNVETPGPSHFPSHDDVINRLRSFLAITENQHHSIDLINEPGPSDCPL
jgi:sugar/nucleoside kinase (ribokinase family)